MNRSQLFLLPIRETADRERYRENDDHVQSDWNQRWFFLLVLWKLEKLSSLSSSFTSRQDGSFVFYSRVNFILPIELNLNDIGISIVGKNPRRLSKDSISFCEYLARFSFDCFSRQPPQSVLMMLIQFLLLVAVPSLYIVWKLSFKDKHDNFLVSLSTCEDLRQGKMRTLTAEKKTK